MNSVLVLYDWPPSSDLNRIYLNSLEDAIIISQQNDPPLAFHWMRLSADDDDDQLEMHNLMQPNIELGCQGYISIIANISKFLEAKYEIQQSSVQRNQDQIFLFLSEELMVDERNDFFTNPILQSNSFRFIMTRNCTRITRIPSVYPNHLLITPDSNESNVFNLWTQAFVGKSLDEITSSMLVDRYVADEMVSPPLTDLYWDKIGNLAGKSLNISTLTYIPYSITKLMVNISK